MLSQVLSWYSLQSFPLLYIQSNCKVKNTHFRLAYPHSNIYQHRRNRQALRNEKLTSFEQTSLEEGDFWRQRATGILYTKKCLFKSTLAYSKNNINNISPKISCSTILRKTETFEWVTKRNHIYYWLPLCHRDSL